MRLRNYFLIVFIALSPCVLAKASPPEIKNWAGLGPFLAAPQESALDPIYFSGGQENLEPDEREFLSPLPKGGRLSWFKFRAKSAFVETKYPDVNWDFLQKQAGNPLLQNTGYFFAELDLPADQVLLVRTELVGEFFINGRRFLGEPYRFSFNKVAAPFKKGKNRILVKVTSYGDPGFRFSLEEPSQTVEVLDDTTTPDLSTSVVTDPLWVGLPLLNTTESWIRNLRVKVHGAAIFRESETPISYSIAPLGVLKIPLILHQEKAPENGSKSQTVEIEIYSGKDLLTTKSLNLRVRRPEEGESFTQTFISKHDQSVQYYSVLYPRNFDAKKRYDLVLALHGANVEASDLTEHFAPKDWAFVVAPTNRRPHGFAYQDLGRLDVLEVLELVQRKLPIQNQNVYLAGHSMGGQGTWHIGLHHPSLFSGLAPSAGWTSFQLYTPSLFQESLRTSSPEMISLRSRLTQDANNPYFLTNANETPIFITQAERDEVVPAFHSRLMFRSAKNTGRRATYREVDSSEHWFSDPLNEDRGFDSMDNPQQYEFLRIHKAADLPKKFEVKFIDLGIEQKFYWISVESQDRVFSETKLAAELKDKALQLTTQNIRALNIHLPRELTEENKIKILWNGKSLTQLIPKSREIRLQISTQGLKQLESSASEKSHAIKYAFFSPYLLVYGTSGTTADTQNLLESAKLFSNRAWRNGNALAPIVSDREVTKEMIRNYNLILFGAPSRNSLVKRWQTRLPFKFEGPSINLQNQRLEEKEGLALATLYPTPDQANHFIVIFAGTTPAAETFASSFQPFFERLAYSLPDFVIFSKAVKYSGFGGIRAAGFFSKTWDLSNKDFVLN